MKKVMLVTLLAASAGLAFAQKTAPSSTTVKLGKGTVKVYDYGDYKVHAYETADYLADEAFIIETKTALIGIESPAFHSNLKEYKAYIDGLKKPLAGMLVSAHPNGADYFAGVTFYATEGAETDFRTGSTKALIDSFIGAFGADFDATLPKKVERITGTAITIGDLDFNIIDRGTEYDIEIPAINVYYTHMLGADTHSIIPSVASIDGAIKTLQGYKKKGYNLILSSHHTPETLKDVDTKIAYYKAIKAIAKRAKTKDDFIAQVKAKYGTYQGDNYLEMTAGFLYQ